MFFASLCHVWLDRLAGFSYLLRGSISCNVTYQVVSGKLHWTLMREWRWKRQISLPWLWKWLWPCRLPEKVSGTSPNPLPVVPTLWEPLVKGKARWTKKRPVLLSEGLCFCPKSDTCLWLQAKQHVTLRAPVLLSVDWGGSFLLSLADRLLWGTDNACEISVCKLKALYL